MNYLEHLTQRTKGLHYGWLDLESEIYTIPLWNLSGQLIGSQRYNWKSDKKKSNDKYGRYWTYVTKQYKSTSIFAAGIDLIDTSKPLALVEGMFEMLTAHSVGINAIAVLKLRNICDKHIVLNKDLDDYDIKELNRLKEVINVLCN